MAAAVNFLQLTDIDLGIDGGGLEFCVAQELLNLPHVDTTFQHVRRARMPNHVAASRGHDSRV